NVCPTPSVILDECGGNRWEHHRAAPSAGGGDAKRRVAMPDEPSTDDRQGRQVTAGAADTNADAIGQIAKPDMVGQSGNAEAGSEDQRADRDDGTRLEAVREPTRQRAQ